MTLARSLHGANATARSVSLPVGLVLLSVLSTTGFGQAQDWRKQLQSDATLGTVRRIFLNQTVIIGGRVSVGDFSFSPPGLLDWNIASREGCGAQCHPATDGSDGYFYLARYYDTLPTSYKGKTAIVVAVRLHGQEQKTNALGEIISDDATVNPNFDLVVQFDDGTLAMLTGYPDRLTVGTIELESVAAAIAEQMAKGLPLLIGKDLYAVGFSRLYQPDTSLEELTGTVSFLKRLSPTDVPRLVPLPILAARYVEGAGVVFKLKLPNGSEAIAFTSQPSYQDKPFFERVSGSLLVKMPSGLTQKDIDAIRQGSVSKGMRRDTLYYALGYPDKENNWGRGGKQLIYGDRLLFYLDENERVVDWQSLDR